MDSESYSTSQWIQFFRDAGLPPNVAANYAIIFSDNRIQLNMLMDLSKEYLYDMGIKVMGDVIAILKYAKNFHNELTKEKMIGGVAAPSSSPSAPQGRNTTTRMLSHYTRPISSQPVMNHQKRIYDQSQSKSLKKSNLDQHQKSHSQVVSLKKISFDNASSLKRPRSEITSNDESYQVKMPIGLTPRSRLLLQKHHQLQMKKSVFERLGDDHVSSSTDIKRTKVSSSVFDRLGPSSTEVSTSTHSIDTEPSISGHSLQYQGVLKRIPTSVEVKSSRALLNTAPAGKATVVKIGSKPLTRTVLNNPRMGSVIATRKLLLQSHPKTQHRFLSGNQATVSGGIFGNHSAAKVSVLNRLGTKVIGGSTLINKQSRNRLVINPSQSVFQRLGSS